MPRSGSPDRLIYSTVLLVALVSVAHAAIFVRMAEADALVIAAYRMLIAALVLLPIAALTWPATPISLKAWAAAITMGLFSTALAYILYFRLIANTGPTNAITVTYLIPLFAMLLGAVVINEPITGSMLIGCAVILLGTALATGLLRLPAASRK